MIPIRRKETGVSRSIRLMLAAGAMAATAQASALETTIGDVELSINSTVTAGTSWRAEARDPALYGSNNVDERGNAGQGFSNTGDDGNLNFDKGDTFSTIIKGVHDIEARKDNYGFFGRVKWFYDYQLNREDLFHGHEPTGNVRNRELDDNGFHPYARFDGVDLLDAFGYVNTEIGDKPLDVRLGRQVISWGESTLILSPISGLNTIDVNAFRRPGASLKEGFTPSEMLYANLGLTDDTSLEAFYQLKWRKTVIEGCGTYFSTADFAADGCDRLAFIGTAPVPDSVQLSPGFGTPGSPGFSSPPFFAPINRSEDLQPGNSGQMGMALRKYFTDLDTEFGLYVMNYHSRLPMISVKAGSTPTPQTLPLGPGGSQVPAQAVGLTPGNSLPYAFGNLDGTYYIDYPEDIPVLGLSAVTNVGGWALSGEFSYAGDVPIQYNPNDLLAATLTYGVGKANPNPLEAKLRNTKPGERVNGYERFDVAQLQSTLIKTFDRALGSNTIVLIGEAAAVFVRDLPEALPGQRFGRNAVFGAGAAGDDGYVSDFSWGYRLRTRATYRNVLGNVDLIPSLAWAHDVKGWSPEPGQNFNEGRRSTTLGMTFEFDANTQANISYTAFADSAKYNPLRDRDFATVSFSLSF